MDTFLNYCIMVVEYLRLITISDLVDILILTYLIYHCINLLQWTNAAKVAKALLLMVAGDPPLPGAGGQQRPFLSDPFLPERCPQQ